MTQEKSQVATLLKEAVALHQAGKLSEAEAGYRQVLVLAPGQFDALQLLGVVARQQGDPGSAVELIARALRIDPAQAAAHANLGAALQDLGRGDEALASYERALHINPGYAMAHYNRGNALRKLGRPAEALAAYERALALRPAYPEAWCNRAIALLELGEARGALASSEQALAGRRPYAEASCVRANALFGLREFEAALRGYEEAIAADARAPEAHEGRGLALLKLGRAPEALPCFDTVLALRPGQARGHQQRGDCLLALGRRDEAIGAFETARERALQAGQDAGEVEFALAALGVGTAPPRAPPGYVSALFDQYAGHFERHLTGVLAYRTPGLVAAALDRHVAVPGIDSEGLDTVDLGCGTGLCAPHLRPRSRSLAGVDLSARMLDQARATGLYDELACADIEAWLAGRSDTFDLAVAADVLVYVGDLAGLFAQVRAALRPGGWFCFSTEAADSDAADSADYLLLPSNRYAHSLAYLRRLAGEHGFALIEAERAAVRSENGAAVTGHLLVLRAA